MEAGRLIAEAKAAERWLSGLPEMFVIMGQNDQARVQVTETYGSGPIRSFSALSSSI